MDLKSDSDEFNLDDDDDQNPAPKVCSEPKPPSKEYWDYPNFTGGPSSSKQVEANPKCLLPLKQKVTNPHEITPEKSLIMEPSSRIFWESPVEMGIALDPFPPSTTSAAAFNQPLPHHPTYPPPPPPNQQAKPVQIKAKSTGELWIICPQCRHHFRAPAYPDIPETPPPGPPLPKGSTGGAERVSFQRPIMSDINQYLDRAPLPKPPRPGASNHAVRDKSQFDRPVFDDINKYLITPVPEPKPVPERRFPARAKSIPQKHLAQMRRTVSPEAKKTDEDRKAKSEGREKRPKKTPKQEAEKIKSEKKSQSEPVGKSTASVRTAKSQQWSMFQSIRSLIGGSKRSSDKKR